MKSKRRYFFLPFIVLFFFNAFSQEAVTSFTLVSGKRSKVFNSRDFLQVENDTFVEGKNKTGRITGEFLYIKNNNFFLKPVILEDDIKSKEYKWFSEGTDSIIGYESNKISRLIYDTDAGNIGAAGFWVSAVSALIVSPLVSIKRGGGFDVKRCLTISGISFGSLALSTGVIVFFGERTFEISAVSTSKKKRWVLRY